MIYVPTRLNRILKAVGKRHTPGKCRKWTMVRSKLKKPGPGRVEKFFPLRLRQCILDLGRERRHRSKQKAGAVVGAFRSRVNQNP